MNRPNLEDYEYYDPQSMQEYAYVVEAYMNKIEAELANKDAEIAELVTSLEAMINFVSIYSDGYYRLPDTEAFKAAEALLIARSEKDNE